MAWIIQGWVSNIKARDVIVLIYDSDNNPSTQVESRVSSVGNIDLIDNWKYEVLFQALWLNIKGFVELFHNPLDSPGNLRII